MDKYNRDRENASGRTLHTYTPRSHEDLLRSHLQLDASRNARLQNELQRMADENKRLRRDLDNAQKDIKDKDDEIDDLKKKLRERPKTPSAPERVSIASDPNKVFELDGKPVTLDQILNHFDGVIQKHHDLLDKKNRQIDDLEDALRNRPALVPKNLRNAETQSLGPREDNKQDEFAKELALIRKEYEQVERILTDRNNKLENLIEELKRKLDQYANEIGRLREELAARGLDPNESTMRLLNEKEKENDYLKDLINNIQKQPAQSVMPMTYGITNEDLENEIKKIIEDKKKAVKKISNMIIDLKKTPSGNVGNSLDVTDVERECKEIKDNMNDRLNNVLLKLRQMPQSAQGEPVNKDDLVHDLNNLKKECENEIEALKKQLHSPSDSPIVLTGVGQVVIDDPELLKRKYPDKDIPKEVTKTPSNVKFHLYPPLDRNPTPESSLRSYRPVDYRPVTPEVSYRHLPAMPKERLYPEIPSETHSVSPKPRPHSPVTCEACQENYKPPRSYDKPEKVKPTHEKPKKKGCCGGKGSETSNVPYKKAPAEEEIMYIHQPHSQHKQPRREKSDHSPSERSRPDDSPKSKRKLVSKLKPDRK